MNRRGKEHSFLDSPKKSLLDFQKTNKKIRGKKRKPLGMPGTKG